jgi:DNA-binding XRE family transcriptional regulator
MLSCFVAIVGASCANELWLGIHHFLIVPGTITEIENGDFERYAPTWTVSRKIAVLVLLYMTGLFGGSCLGAITRRFGALAMTLTSTTRKAATMFVSFSLFSHNTCTNEHILGISLYISSLLLKGYQKSLRQKENTTAQSLVGPQSDTTTREREVEVKV